MTNIQVRIATPEDARAIRQVQHDTWIATYPNDSLGITLEQIKRRVADYVSAEKVKSFQDMLANDNLRSWVATESETAIGYAVASRGEDHNTIGAIYVLPEYHGQHVGSKLIEHALEWLGKAKNIEVEVASYNGRAIRFYKKYGFAENGRTGDSDGIPTMFLTKHI